MPPPKFNKKTECPLQWQFLGKPYPRSLPKSMLCVLCAAIYILFILESQLGRWSISSIECKVSFMFIFNKTGQTYYSLSEIIIVRLYFQPAKMYLLSAAKLCHSLLRNFLYIPRLIKHLVQSY